MTLTVLLIALASLPAQGAEIILHSRVPVEVAVDDERIATLLAPADLHLSVEAGLHELLLWVNGSPHSVEVDVPARGAATVVVGRTGVTTGVIEAEPVDPELPATVQLRGTGGESVEVRLGAERHIVDPAGTVELQLPAGTHPLSLRNTLGTVIWATGELVLPPDGEIVVQVADGRAPEVMGAGSVFRSGS